jgi:hypothetical protein
VEEFRRGRADLLELDLRGEEHAKIVRRIPGMGGSGSQGFQGS